MGKGAMWERYTICSNFLCSLAAARPNAGSVEGMAKMAPTSAGKRGKINIKILAGQTAAAAQTRTRKWLYLLYFGLFILSL